jgi:hypothetical protein
VLGKFKFVRAQSPKAKPARASALKRSGGVGLKGHALAPGPKKKKTRCRVRSCLESRICLKSVNASVVSCGPSVFALSPIPYCCCNTSPMELSSYERDFQVARELRTLQENTDPENLIPATRHRIEANDRHVHASPGRPPAGALTIAQVWPSCL